MLEAFTCYNKIGTALSKFTSYSKKYKNADTFRESLGKGIKARAKGLPLRLAR